MDTLTAQPFNRPEDFKDGRMILVNKPLSWTSFDVVNKVRYALKRKLDVKKIKVGHSGTLDPMATGLLIICTGKLTKALHQLQGFDKSYLGEMTIGATTQSYDRESALQNITSIEHVTKTHVRDLSQKFIGEIDQVPPIFSAIKKDGATAYQLARRGKSVELDPRRVEIMDFKIRSIMLPVIHFSVHCSKGFYVRSLAHDFGQQLGVGAYLSALHRTTIGPHRVEDAWNLSKLVSAIDDLPDPEYSPAEGKIS